MNIKRKISWRKILQTVVTIVVVTGCCIAVLSAAEIQQKRKISGLKISIENDQYHFIDKAGIKRMLMARHIDAAHTNLAKLNVAQIESTIRSIPWVDKAQVYIDNAKTLNISVTQRVPVARVFDQAGNSYYVDKTLKTMPLSDRYTHYTTVVTNVPVFTNDSLDRNFKASIVAMVKHIDTDSFWSAQISQIMVNDSMEFELMPILGNHFIKFGDTTRLKEKFNNLFAFYTKVLNRVGWDKYEVLDVRFNKQVVASPALPWKVPVDKAAANMNWVKAIIGNEPPEEITMPDTGIITEPITPKAATPVPATKPVAVNKPATSINKKQQAPKQAPATTGTKQKAVATEAKPKQETQKVNNNIENTAEPQPKYIYREVNNINATQYE